MIKQNTAKKVHGAATGGGGGGEGDRKNDFLARAGTREVVIVA